MASFRINAGTEIVAASGAQLSGNLTTSFLHWEGGTTNGIKLFPGGQLSVNNNGNPGLIYLACGIFAEIRDQDSKVASTISDPINCTAQINKAVYNPLTKTKLIAGQSVPIWHMNDESGVWESKGNSAVQQSGDNLTAAFSMTSPGLYLLGWINESICTTPLAMHPGTLAEYNKISYAFYLNVYEMFETELRFVRTVGLSGQVAEDFNLRMLPENSELVLRFEPYTAEDKPYYKIPDPILLTGYCKSGTTINFDLLPNTGSSYKQIEVVFIDVEHNNTRYNPKVFPGYYRKIGTSVWQSAFVYEGRSYIVNPVEGAQYEMGINFKGRFHLKEVTNGPEDIVLVEIAID
jgi:hypothetical protein